MTHRYSIIEDDSTVTSELTPPPLKNLKSQTKSQTVIRDAKIDDLQTEILILRRQMPRLRDMNGKDVTNEFMLLADKLDKKNYEVEELTAELEQFKRLYSQRDMQQASEEHGQKLQSLRKEFENSIISEFGEGGKNALEQAKKLLSAEYETKIATLNAEMEALRTENQQHIAELQDLAEQDEIEDENVNRFEQMETYFQEELEKRDKIINDLRRNGNNEMKNKDAALVRLKEDLSFLDGNWKKNDVLRAEVERLINEQSDEQETVSQICDNLAGERSRMSVDSECSSIADGNETVHGAFIQMSKFKELIQPLIQHLKKLPKFLKEVDGMNQNSQYHVLMEQIESITIDLDATIKDVTGAINELEDFERTFRNRTPTPADFRPQPTVTNLVNMVTLENEVKTLRAKIADEIGKKQNAMEEWKAADAEVDRLTRRVQELTDEKITLQKELEDLEADFNELKERYYGEEKDDGPEDVQKLSDALAEARSSIKRRSKEFVEVQIELDEARKNIADILNEYRELKKKSNETEQLLKEKEYDINILLEEMDRLKTENGNLSQEPHEYQTMVQKYAADRHQLLLKVESLKHDNSDLLTQNQQIQENYSATEREVKEFRRYMTALIHKMDKDDPRSIECPSFLSPNTNEHLMSRLDSTTAKVVQNFDYAYKKLAEIKNIYDNIDEGENSIASNPEIANGIEKTLDEMITELIKSRNISNEIIREIKKILVNKAKLDLSWLLQKNRELRNFLHLSAKFFEAKKKRIEDGAALPDIIGELGKIHGVLNDANEAARVLTPAEVQQKGKRYR